MKNENVIRFYDDKHQEREIIVKDDNLHSAEKISLRMVKNICIPSLEEHGYKVKKSDLQWISLSENCVYNDAYSLHKNVCGLCLFTFECCKGGENFLATYAPYGKLVHVLEESEYQVVRKATKQQIQLNLTYFFDNVNPPIFKDVNLIAKVAQIKRHFWGGPGLKLLSEKLITKTVNFKEEDAIEAFGRGFSFSEKVQEGKLFEFTGSLD